MFVFYMSRASPLTRNAWVDDRVLVILWYVSLNFRRLHPSRSVQRSALTRILGHVRTLRRAPTRVEMIAMLLRP